MGMHTPDVPVVYTSLLAAMGWKCEPVEYLTEVSGSFFHNWRRSRFLDVFTKLRVLRLIDYEKVLMLDLDLLVREGGIETIFNLEPPAAMKRGPPVPCHGDTVTYAELWTHCTRRSGDAIPPHQQASGINAGVMLFKPDMATYQQMEAEVLDWYHPEHYATYMPEQEYLGRFFGTFDRWRHIDCKFNFEIDKNERIPHDFTEAHEVIRANGSTGHVGGVVLHYSGTSVKPWDLLFASKENGGGLLVGNATQCGMLLERLKSEGPGSRLDGYTDTARLWDAMLEWMGQLLDALNTMSQQSCNPLEVVRSAIAADPSAAAK